VANCRGKEAAGARGNIWWNIQPLMENRKGIVNVFKDELYNKPALTPPMARFAGQPVAAPQVAVQGRKLELSHQDAAPLRAWTVYRPAGDSWELDRIVPGNQKSVELPAGRWAVAAATKHGNESQGVVVDLS
jgi:hypothetical protein